MTALTLPQQDIYYDQLLYPGKALYNIGAKIEVNGPLDAEVLNAAYRDLIEQHDALRMVIAVENNEPGFSIIDTSGLRMDYMDFSAAADPAKEAELYMQEQFVVPFNLLSGELLHRSCIIKVTDSFHYLFSVYHHLVTDGWGTSLMYQRFVRNYNEILETGAVQTRYPFAYASFAEEDANYKGSESYLQDRGYWVNRFGTLPEDLIPKRNTSGSDILSNRRELTVSRALYEELNTVARENGVTTFHVVLGVLYVYFGRFYNNHDFAIGLPVLNRLKPVYKNTVGLFMGISPLRIQPDFERSFPELLTLIRNQLRQDYRHQRFPFGKLVKELNAFAGLEKLFNITVSFEKHDYSHAFAGTRTKVIPLTHRAERVALALYVREFDEREDVKIHFDYSLNYFDEPGAERLIRHIEVLLKAVAARPSENLSKINFLTAPERQQLTDGSHDTKKPLPRTTVQQMVDAQAASNPCSLAVRDDDTAIDYGTLKTLSDRFAGHLDRTLGKADRSPVAVLLERSAYLPVVLLGILKAGRSFIPLDPSFPVSRLEYILDHSGSKIMVTRGGPVPALNPEGILALDINQVFHQPGDQPYSPDHGSYSEDDPAYIIYTSGSTGNPKGVEITQRSLVNFLMSMKEEPGLKNTDVLFAVTTYSFDISILELFLPLVCGASVYVAGRDTLAEPSKIISRLAEIKPTVIQATPSFYQLLFNAGWEGDKNLKCLCGGDMLSSELAANLSAGCRDLWNMYGPTETTIWSTLKKVQGRQDAGNIGKPIGNTDIYILDQWLNPVPVGAMGIIYIGGEGLARGYYRNEKLTAESFIENPFDKGKRIFRTGDVGKWNEQGEILFYGRMDNQVKIRGYRIELGEVEKNLAALPGIREAAVVARKGENAEAFLAAYIIPEEKQPDAGRIIDLLKTRLPDYMVPRVIIGLEEFPLTPNKKIDRKALAARAVDTGSSEDPASLHPQTEMEERLLPIWKTILNLAGTPGVTQNFFSLGGHSLNAVKLAAEVKNELGFDLSIREVFEHPSVRLLARYLESTPQKTRDAIVPVEDADDYPLTPAQRRLWLVSQKTEASIAYNMSTAYRAEGIVDKASLQKAMEKIISRHEILRTNFTESGGIPRQRIRPAAEASFLVKEHKLPAGESPDELLASIAYTAFDLEHDLLVKMDLVEQEGGPRLLVFTAHHLIMDGWSVEVLIRELILNYNQCITGREIAASPLAFQFRDYSTWLNRHIAANESHQTYWLQKLKGYRHKPAFAYDRHTASAGFDGRMISFAFTENETSGLKEFARAQSSTLFTLLAAVMNALVFRHSGHEDICLGTVTSGRDIPGLDDQLGMYAHTVVLRTIVDGDAGFAGLLEQMRATLLEAAAFQEYPFEKALDRKGSPVFDVMIVYQNPEFAFSQVSGLNGLSLRTYPLTHKVSRLPMTFNFFEEQGRLCCNIEYNPALFSEGTVRIILEKFRKLAGEVIADPRLKLADYNITLHIEEKIREAVSIDLDF
ncbi:MAG TPA: amino acid adenylation domain-containing protein [Flavisolibacter sp.]|jgi:amino acid adenylation domain-containing protein